MDMAKAIAFAALQKEDVLDFLTWKLSSEGRPCLPIGEIVTYPSSGSEMDGSAQIDDDETNVHMGLSGIYPSFAWLNPRYMDSIPKEILVYGTMTSVAQISTGYLSMESSDVAESVSAAMIKSLIRNLQNCIGQPDNQEAHKNLMLASALNSTGILGFGKGYDWTLIPLEGLMQTYYGIGYSKAITIMFPYWLKHIYRDHPVFTSYFENVFGLGREGKTPEEFLRDGLNAIFGIYRELGIATCYNELVQKPLDRNRLWELIQEYGEMPSQYMEFTAEKIEEILLEAIEGLADER